MFIKSSLLRHATFADIPAGSFILSNRDAVALWMISRRDGDRDTVFLSDFNGYRWSLMDANSNQAWSGFFVEPVEVEVDITSRVAGGAESLGMLRVDSGKLQLYAGENDSGWDAEWVDIGQAPGVVGRAGKFSRWRLTFGSGDEKVTLVENDGANVTILGSAS